MKGEFYTAVTSSWLLIHETSVMEVQREGRMDGAGGVGVSLEKR